MVIQLKYFKLIGSVLLVLIVLLQLYYKSYPIEFEEVYKCENIGNNSYIDGAVWLTITDEKFNQFYNTEDLEKMLQYDFDKENYSYIVCYGHELKKLSFQVSNPKRRILLFVPYEIVGNALLDKNEDNMIYVYRIKKMNLTVNYHDTSSCTFYN